jgi:5-oxoprolinase (ATP-hydrolysing)
VCYRKGGKLSLTDANAVLGRIQPDFFPKIFGKSEREPLDVDGARAAMSALTEEINAFYAGTGATSLLPCGRV